MDKPKKTPPPDQSAERAMIQLVAALLTNPNVYPKNLTERGVMDTARRYYELIKDATTK